MWIPGQDLDPDEATNVDSCQKLDLDEETNADLDQGAVIEADPYQEPPSNANNIDQDPDPDPGKRNKQNGSRSGSG